jgi:hypothetical protein
MASLIILNVQTEMMKSMLKMGRVMVSAVVVRQHALISVLTLLKSWEGP